MLITNQSDDPTNNTNDYKNPHILITVLMKIVTYCNTYFLDFTKGLKDLFYTDSLSPSSFPRVLVEE